MTAPLKTTMASGTADQKPMTLCQLKSRAFARRPPLNHAMFRICRHVQIFGIHK